MTTNLMDVAIHPSQTDNAPPRGRLPLTETLIEFAAINQPLSNIWPPEYRPESHSQEAPHG